MKIIEISINTHGVTKKATIECDRQKRTLTFIMENGLRRTYTGHDLYACLGLLRADFPEVKFLCKGAKLNVYPSRMSSQMSGGVVAYELQMGKPAENEDVVNIFDFEENDITHDIQQQRDFYNHWITSLAE
ncbi:MULTISPECIES: hypothetical protein [unclassified Pseudomonas]|jgi:hypothetical protein|uniref:hypothetical protein n=1 Tax=unclassified Pseudomonas TaxID=196821 RepID=UPI0011F3566F|nr:MULTISPECIES: hypothetical protein [unclassified Pseudomonas]KAA0978831.1 hypothetical protein FQ187_25520 [Pseudomonas sp. ANT_J28]MBV7512783.1 hypothetical protein [Pseudomonas sp. PDM25]